MASLSFSQFHLPPRLNSKNPFLSSVSFVQVSAQNFQNRWMSSVSSRRGVVVSVAQEDTVNESPTKKKSQRTKSNSSTRGRKKASKGKDTDGLAVDDNLTLKVNEADEKPKKKTSKKASSVSKTSEEGKKTRGRKKKVVEAASEHGGNAEGSNLDGKNEDSIGKTEKKSRRIKGSKIVNETQKPVSDTEESNVDPGSFIDHGNDAGSAEKKSNGRGIKKKVDMTHDTQDSDEATDIEDEGSNSVHEDSDNDIGPELVKVGDDEDISFTYGWPPLVCCFGAAQHAFVPSGRPANRLIDHELHERMKNALWSPDRYVRAPGGCAGNVAMTLAALGGRVALMGKLGDDDFGQAMLYYLNVSKVQTRSVRMDGKRLTATSKMKIVKRGGLRVNTVKPSAEDSLSQSEINVDVLKEANMFHFNTFSLLDENMRKTTLLAIRTAKHLGNMIFYDVNLPLPLWWKSKEETKEFIQQVWDLADVIEVTKQELEFLCGIKPSEKFDTMDNHPSKFFHYEPEVISPLWHEGLKVLFVTNGTSKIHYYTKEHDGSVLGMEDAPITPFTKDMSASGDGIVAGLLRMLTLRPDLVTDKKYLERSIKYAISCGITDQWLQARDRGFPPLEGMEEEVIPDSDGIVSITEREFRTVVPAAASPAAASPAAT